MLLTQHRGEDGEGIPPPLLAGAQHAGHDLSNSAVRIDAACSKPWLGRMASTVTSAVTKTHNKFK
jgi:hypothetical protein